MAPVDAEAYWLAPKTRSDQFLLFAFDAAEPRDVGTLRAGLIGRARSIPDLNLAVRETFAYLDFPYWVPCPARESQVVARDPAGSAWQDCLDDVASLISEQLDPRREAWRVHLYPTVLGLPDGTVRGSVAVLQISHALADGRGSTALARQLFGTDVNVDSGFGGGFRGPAAAAIGGLVRLPIRWSITVGRGWRAFRLSRDDPAGPAAVSPGPLNVAPGEDRQLRVVVVDAERLRIGQHGVTVGAIMAISDALAGARILSGDERLVVELTIGRASDGLARNNFHTAAVDSHCEIADRDRRADAIAQSIEDARRRDAAPGRAASRRATEATPAFLMRWGAGAFDPAVRSSMVTGHTVVSSVNRGAADLTLAGGRVLFTTGFPALSVMQGATHGVHGIGSTVALSVTTSRRVLPDVDGYVDVLCRVCASGPNSLPSDTGE
ncbi:wax ester/triacylglycerol synthase domain-containing protein [Jongsikchunia kroppenstedtii]|uniref:wax ester/triacylglycerol synthase domain-containing protein n=1 Tax=Jongsikchunia kroppenstedtii TaxID=1121721 RepID=UPI0003671190|nr:wax ester/triacylglycerol synthase domain-containing protein [Jongsikchunia kroppenstedtii]